MCMSVEGVIGIEGSPPGSGGSPAPVGGTTMLKTMVGHYACHIGDRSSERENEMRKSPTGGFQDTH
jgi:hypothetical protein